MDNQQILKKAEERVAAKKGYYWHLIVYLIMGVFFFTMNMLTEPDKIWFIFPMLAWGIGLMFHTVGVFGIPGLHILGNDWENQQLQKEIDRLQELQRKKEELMLLEGEEDMMNINEKDYIKMKQMRNRDFE